MKFAIILNLLLAVFLTSCAQDKYSHANERVVKKISDVLLIKDHSGRPAGSQKNLLIFQKNRNVGSSQAATLIHYDEKSQKVVDSIKLEQQTRKIISVSQLDDLKVFHGFFSVSPQFQNKTLDDLSGIDTLLEYQDIWLQDGEKETKLMSFNDHFYDKEVYYSIDSSGKYIVINTFVSTYLRSTEADSIISIFEVSDGIDQLKRYEISCFECIAPQIVGRHLYYGKKFFYERGADVYDWKLYRAPIFDLAKSELIAEYIELKSVSPDGKYAIGEKSLFGKGTLVLIDVAQKKFEYLLGRPYTTLTLFYSPSFQQFAFDRKNDIIYLEYPEKFPYNSIGEDVKPKRTTDEEDKLFWDHIKPNNN
jgi:hypothetical protein